MTEKENAIVPVEEHNIKPAQLVTFASDAAKHLKDIVEKTKSSIMLGKNEHLKFEAWQTIAKFYGSTVTVDWTKPILMQNEGHLEEVFGYEAKASVIDKDGKILSSAESGCFKDEDNWRNKPSFQLRSMAQTRACAKALRNVYSWVVVLSGYAPTPAEEMDQTGETESGVPTGPSHYGNRTSGPLNITPRPAGNTTKIIEQAIKEDEEKHTRPATPRCVAKDCGKLLSHKVYDYSMTTYGVPFCYDHQQEMKKLASGDFTNAADVKEENMEE